MVSFSALKIFAVRYGLLVTFGQYAYADTPPFAPRNPLRTQTKNAVPKIFLCASPETHKILRLGIHPISIIPIKPNNPKLNPSVVKQSLGN